MIHYKCNVLMLFEDNLHETEPIIVIFTVCLLSMHTCTLLSLGIIHLFTDNTGWHVYRWHAASADQSQYQCTETPQIGDDRRYGWSYPRRQLSTTGVVHMWSVCTDGWRQKQHLQQNERCIVTNQTFHDWCLNPSVIEVPGIVNHSVKFHCDPTFDNSKLV